MEWFDNRPRTALFLGMWLFVIFVSVFDGYLVLRHRDSILMFERNPLGRALVLWNGGCVWYLLAAKSAGTVVACAALLLIRRVNERVGLIIAAALAGLQLCLLLFLIFA